MKNTQPREEVKWIRAHFSITEKCSPEPLTPTPTSKQQRVEKMNIFKMSFVFDFWLDKTQRILMKLNFSFA